MHIADAPKTLFAQFADNHAVIVYGDPSPQKEGPAYDLPIAVALLAVSGQLPEDLDHSLFLGELSLDGTVRHVNGVLPMAHLARELGYNSVFVPQSDAPEAEAPQAP